MRFNVLSLAIVLSFALPFSGVADNARQENSEEAFQVPQRSMEQELPRVREWLAGLPVIRVVVTDAPKAGHQSASLAVARHLRDLGYKGKIELVYDEDAKDRLEFLLPNFNPSSLRSWVNKVWGKNSLGFGIDEALSFKQVQDRPQVELAITGGSDQLVSPTKIKANNLLTLQPYAWRYRPYIVTRNDVWSFPDQFTEIAMVWSRAQPPANRSPNLLGWLRNRLQAHQSLSVKEAGLFSVFNGVQHQFDLAPVYGHYVHEGHQLIRYIKGLDKAKRDQPKLFSKAILIPVLNQLGSEDLQELHEIIREHHLPANIQFANIEDRNLPNRIQTLSSDQILVVQTGAVPMEVFEALYQSATLPPLVEGRNSINLMMLLGRPYLPSILHETFHFLSGNIKTQHLSAVRLAQSAAQALRDGLFDRPWDTEINSNAEADLSKFFIAARQPADGSSVTELFAAHQVQISDPRNDRLLMGLAATKWVLSETRERTTCERRLSGHLPRD